MWISDISIRRPVFATMVIMSFMVLGIVSLTRLGIDLFPDVNFPFVNVGVVYPGASPEEVETLVTRPIEDAVAGINGVKRVVSSSTESLSRVGLELRLEVDPQTAAAEVREKVAAIRSRLPEQIEDPTIVRFDVAALPIMTFAVGSSQRSDITRRQVEDDLKPLLEQIDGVAAVEVNGGEVREIQVELDPGRLEALGLPVSVVAEKLAADNLDLPGGQMRQASQSISLRTKGEFETVDEIERVILRSDGGSTVRVSDVGRVVDGFEERISTTRLDGVDAVSFSVKKQSGANTAAIAERVHAALARAASAFPQLQIRTVHDDAEFIRENVAQVREAIVFGAAMAVLVVFIFMRDWRSTLITALALPTSVISTFFFMWIAGFTINMMTLMALSLVIGILIDDAVVVRENIYRHMEHGEDPMTAARRGTAEIGLAVMATTFTILAVFLPVGFMTGLVGQFFKSFALTIAFAVAMSLFVAFTLDPMLSSRFVRYVPPEERVRTRAGRLFERMGRAYDSLDRGYHRVLRVALNNPWKSLGFAAAVFVISLSSITVMGTEFVPAEDRGEFQVILELPPGTSFDESVATVARVEQAIRRIPEVTQVFSTVGTDGQVRSSSLRVKVTKKDQRERAIGEIKDQVRALLAKMAFVDGRVGDPEFMQGAPYEPPINVFIRGDDLPTLQRVASEVQAKVSQIPGAVDISSNLESGQPEVVARVNRSIAADLGFSVGAIATQLRGMVEGIVPTRLRDGDREHDIRVRLAPEYRNDPVAVLRTPLYSPSGAAVRTSDVVAFAPGVGPSNIDREQRRRQAKIGIDLAPGYALGDVTAEVQRVVASISMPPTFEWGFAGDVELMQESAAAMGLAMILAVAFIYIVLASQFESFLQPMIIMLSLPLALVGALLLLLATGKNLGMSAMIGVVMLMGLVTKNAILLVDYTNHLRRDGLPLKDALLSAGPVRLRPIVMTTVAMILGMLPSALGTGDGSEFRSPISIATIGGLLTSTLLTLVVVPVAYLLLEGAVERVRAWRRAPMPAGVHAAARVAGVLLLLALLSAFLGVASVFAQTGNERTARISTAVRSEQTRVEGQASSGPLTIDRALDLALARNEDLKATGERLRESQANVAQARAAFLPSLDVNFLYTPTQASPVLRIPAGIFGPTEQTFRANLIRENVVRFDVTQPVYTGGRLAHAYGAEAATQEASRLDLERARQTVTLRVYETFYAALMADQGVRTSDEGVRIAQRHLELAEVRYQAGSAARLDVLRAEVELANARARLIRARSSAEVSYQALRTALSLPPNEPLQLSGTLDDLPSLPSTEQLQQSVAARPDIRAIGQQREAAEQLVSLANADLKPTVAFTGNLQYQEDGVNRLFDGSNRSFQFGLAMRVPLFNAPAVAARRAAASARVRQTEHRANAAFDGARLELASASTELDAAREIVATQEKAVELARESLGIAEVSYENGVITASELNDTRLSLLETEWELMQAKYSQIVAAARTRFAAGL
jgi:hydrophobic/amphiphilic exporter-1 (mainly G- bacteria), HAE1 family